YVFDDENNVKFDSEKVSKMLNTGKEIAEILVPLKLDNSTYEACLILPFLRENYVFNEEILKDYQDAYNLAKQVKDIPNIEYKNQTDEMENLRSMLIAFAGDIRVMIIRLSEVLNLARHTKELTKEQAEDLHFGIKEVYSPIASRLGLSFIKSEFNDLNVIYFHPNDYKRIMKDIAEDSRYGQEKIDKIVAKLKEILASLNIEGKCYGRVKHISSIYAKLKDKNKTLSQIFDLYAVRVIVKNQDECYAVLSAIHTEFVPIDNRFKDYVSRPKVNGYQSLHTVVLVDDRPIEVQIRTENMHNHAEYGIAAHFLYKEHKTKIDELDDKLLWIKKLLDNKDNLSASDLIENLKTDVYSGEIFVQSPMGKIVQLVENSTPIDFAYAIHSQVGNKCVGAKINGKMMPLSTPLQNGDVVEIITNQNAKGPSHDWLKIAKTSQARNRINQFFRHEMKEENIKKGKSILETNAKNKGYNIKDLMNDKWLVEVLEKYAFHNTDEMFAALGYGSITSAQILNKLIDLYEKSVPKVRETKVFEEVENKTTDIEGLSGIMVKYAKCCGPVPGDEIVGFVSRGNGVTIHRKDCSCIKPMEQDRLMPMHWGNNDGNESKYIASLNVYVDNAVGVLATISTKLAENKINITKIKSSNHTQDEAIINLSFYVKNKKELDEFANKLEALSIVHYVVRGGK
ncbi:MAG: bifunctional (p)ppGpp synthetase/guanosine-3',5'-bis(diphosphate) 3'-pyrophosphohydrolase, partial [Clostridiales bacterium]|nr:bifunctional (p)ppGpp synthetase/guanosine-3',5'-bis(diphosphate) 3'-pyrophosphohydrolase [Candidatus Apopatousia equi]